MKRLVALAALALAPLACGQELKLTVFDRLKPKASDVVNLTLNKNLLDFAASFLGGDKGDGEKLKKLVVGLNGIFVHSLEFDKEGSYTDADVKQIMAEMSGAGWDLAVSADDKKSHEISRIWIKAGGHELGGMRIMSAEAKELSVIEIIGKIRLEDLKDLGGLGIPNIASEHTGAPPKKNEE